MTQGSPASGRGFAPHLCHSPNTILCTHCSSFYFPPFHPTHYCHDSFHRAYLPKCSGITQAFSLTHIQEFRKTTEEWTVCSVTLRLGGFMAVSKGHPLPWHTPPLRDGIRGAGLPTWTPGPSISAPQARNMLPQK